MEAVRGLAPMALAVGLLVAVTAHAGAEGVQDDRGGATGEAPSVELEQLLKLPDSLRYEVERRGGYTKAEWEDRFRAARADLEAARDELRRTQEELENLSAESGSWQYQPPGSGGGEANSPLSYRLLQEIKQQRTEVERAEKRLRELTVEANLASVPDEWRQ